MKIKAAVFDIDGTLVPYGAPGPGQAAVQALRDCEMHSTCMLHSGDEGTLRKMGLRLTSEPEYPSKDLFF